MHMHIVHIVYTIYHTHSGVTNCSSCWWGVAVVAGTCQKANNAAEFIQKLNNKMLIISIVQALSTVDSVEQTVAAKCVNYG